MPTTTTKPTEKRERGRPVAEEVPKPHAVYPTAEEKRLLQEFAERTRRTVGGSILYLALTNPELAQVTGGQVQ